MNVTINPTPVSGVIDAIPSKSYAHRYLICAALASGGSSNIDIGFVSRDIEATAQCLSELGASVRVDGRSYLVAPVNVIRDTPTLHCCESGSTLRFLTPVAAALGGASFVMEGRLKDRPMDELLDCLSAHGVGFEKRGNILTVTGKMTGGEFKIAGNVSSQYISGILFALPLCGGGRITLTTDLESRPYVTMTIQTMAEFGVSVVEDASGFSVSSDQRYTPSDANVPGDWSNAAFWLACGVGVKGVSSSCAQGDKAILDVMKEMGAAVKLNDEVWKTDPRNLCGSEIDAKDIPDLVPIISIIAARAKGITKIYNASRLRIKESDRIETTSAMLDSFGIKNEQTGDGLIIYGSDKPFDSCTIDCANDHRIAMSASIGAIYASGEVTLVGAEAVNKSYPSFFEDYCKLGGVINV